MAYDQILEGKFDRGDELDADKFSVALMQKVGYAPASLGDFLTRLDDRNKDQPERNGLFASHPDTKERIDDDPPARRRRRPARSWRRATRRTSSTRRRRSPRSRSSPTARRA